MSNKLKFKLRYPFYNSFIKTRVDEEDQLKKRLDRIELRFDNYMKNEEHDHDELVKAGWEIEEINKVLKCFCNKKTWLGKIILFIIFGKTKWT
jgi:uncharacterized coiled-coil DUF342 family protein